MNKSIQEYRDELFETSKRGYTILMAGALYNVVLGILTFLLPLPTIQFVWVVGLMAIFPVGVLIGKAFGLNYFVKENPLGNLGGLAAGMQAFYIPVFILVYQESPEFLPFTIGLLGGSHFIIYYWLYSSKWYLFLTLGMTFSAFLIGGYMLDYAYPALPFVFAIIFFITTLGVMKENTNNGINIEI
ncbi:hypothetical protein AA0X95_00910 [Bacillus sp. 1P10SD]|uniref:DUF7010 family protein n=1 Tax=Bacillus sp. 1P10SD TaxID=3132265 RepID=UPI0039A62477